MMAAIRGAENDKVLLIEQNEKLGKKLFITGKGRCNLCNDGDDEQFFDSLHRNGRFMYSSYYSLTSYSLQYFFESGGVPLKVERGQRVFPVSDKSSDVIRRLERELLDRKVEIRYNTKVLNVEKTGDFFPLKPIEDRLLETKSLSLQAVSATKTQVLQETATDGQKNSD